MHSLTLVAVLQHLMGLADAVMIYALLRRNGVSKRWATIASLPVLLDGYLIEDEHLIMTEALFTFLLMVAMPLLLWRGTLVGGAHRRAAGRLRGDRADRGRGGADHLPAVPAGPRLAEACAAGWRRS